MITHKFSLSKILLYIFSISVLLFFLVPVLVVIPMAFSSGMHLQFPPPGFSLRWFENYFSDYRWLQSTLLSFKVAFWATLLSVTLGTLASFSLVRGKFKWKSTVNSLFFSPLIVPVIITGVAVYALFAQFGLRGTTLGLVLGHTILCGPFVLITVTASLQTFDVTLEKAARSLGANSITTFFRITIPNILPGILAGAMFAFIFSFDEIIISIFVAGAHTTLPLKMFENLRTELDPTIAAVATLLIIFSSLFIIITSMVSGGIKPPSSATIEIVKTKEKA